MAFDKKAYMKKYQPLWRKRNKDKMAAYMRKYRKEHPKYVKKQNERRRKKSTSARRTK